MGFVKSPTVRLSREPARMNLPKLEGLDDSEQRAIMLGALAVIQGMMTHGIEGEPMERACEAGHQVRELVEGTLDPVSAVSEWIHLEGKLWLS